MVKVNSWDLRGKRSSSSPENSNSDKSEPGSPGEESAKTLRTGRITRRVTRNSKMDDSDNANREKESNGDFANNYKEDQSQQSQDQEEDNENQEEEDKTYTKADTTEDEMSSPLSSDHNDEESRGYDDVKGFQVRRSRRQRNSIYCTYDESWMVGGGPAALGYSRRRDHHEEDRRRSGRLLESAKNEFDNALINGNAEDDRSEEDMYSRVKKKKRRTSFNGSRTNDELPVGRRMKRPRSSSVPSQQDEEPVSRRLRDRQKLSLSENCNNGFGPKPSIKDLYRRKRRMRKHRRDSSSSSSSSDSDDAKSPSKKRTRRYRDRMLGGTGPGFNMPQQREYSKKEMLMLMEVQPIAVDPNVSFKSVGGLNPFISKLKEIVLFPLMYGDFYEQKCMRPPRGILLHGPPGTGKTLMARALANECSNINGKKVSFFLRKGADLLNKFIGESERQLRMLFQQAALHQPSIIFFDEIDGLAPVRSAKSDQIHNSIVSTLLAELDGLQDRGQIIVIGSTNRLDFIDPALRRPGRFDCELPIFLPTRDGRLAILQVHVSKWKDVVPIELLEELADRCIGFTGADLKLLCWSASMNSLRRTYPQIYGSNQKYLLDYESIKVERDDWELALKTVAPSTNRSLFSKYSPAQPLPLFVKPLLEKMFSVSASVVDFQFPHKSLSLITENSRKRLVLCANQDSGLDTYIVPAILHTMETLPVRVLSHEALHMDGLPTEFAVTQICMEVLKESGPSILYIPGIDRLCSLISDSAKEVILRMLSQSVQKPVLIIATIQQAPAKVDQDDEIMKPFRGCFLRLEQPSRECIQDFFQPVFEQATKVKKMKKQEDDLKELPLAPPDSPQKPIITPEELRVLEKRESAVFRQLRIFLREILSKLVRNKKFEEFTKPVDVTEVPDYLDVVQNPMDLESMMFKLNEGKYLSAEQFLEDIKLIKFNCLSYNPAISDSDKRIRLRAYELADFATTLIDKEMDSDFEDQCKAIIQGREDRKTQFEKKPLDNEEDPGQTPQSCSSVSLTSLPSTSTVNGSQSEKSSFTRIRQNPTGRKTRKKSSSWSKGTIPKPAKKKPQQQNSSQSQTLSQEQQELSPKPICSQGDEVKSISPVQAAVEGPSNGFAKELSPTPTVSFEVEVSSSSCNGSGETNICSTFKKRFDSLLEETVKLSENYTVVELLDLRFQLLRIVEAHQFEENKEVLYEEIKTLLKTRTARKSLHSLLQPRI